MIYLQEKKHPGFTFIELLIILSLLGVLIALAYPSYLNGIIKSRRSDALVGLTQTRILLEDCYAQNHSYLKPCTLLPEFPLSSPQHFYWINRSNLTSSTYTLTAIPQRQQTEDKACTLFSITESNLQTAYNSFSALNNECWS